MKVDRISTLSHNLAILRGSAVPVMFLKLSFHSKYVLTHSFESFNPGQHCKQCRGAKISNILLFGAVTYIIYCAKCTK